MNRFYKTVFIASLMVAVAAAAAPAQDFSVTLRKVQGDVTVLTEAGGEWEKASEGETLASGAAVRTGQKSSCVLRWKSGFMKVESLSKLEVSAMEESRPGGKKFGFNLQIGKIYANVDKLQIVDSSFYIKTPTAVAAVRGTEFFVYVEEDSTSIVGVIEGEIAVEAAGVETALSQDFVITVSPESAPSAPEPIIPEVKKEAEEQIEDAREKDRAGEEPEVESETEEGEAEKAEEPVAGEEESSAVDTTETETVEEAEDTVTVAEKEIPEENAPAPEEVAPVEPEVESVVEPDIDAVADAAAESAVEDVVIDNIIDEIFREQIIEEAHTSYETGELEINVTVEPLP
ncbi:FecR domain-containing protein [bacterium]